MSEIIPEFLAERLRQVDHREPNLDGEFIVYWMRHALRAHENPALDTALIIAKQLGKPIWVYQQLLESYPFNSDRHHLFILQGAIDVHAEFAARGIGSALYLERHNHRGTPLHALASRACVVVTEDFPTEPSTAEVQRLLQGTSAPIYLVDTACIAPMKLVGKAYDRAFAFRDATKSLYAKRLTRPWVEQPDPERCYIPALLPFEPVNLARESVSRLIAECDIDHTVGPVPHTRGGSLAGYRRWEQFKSKGLFRYAADRNDALRDGVSRMSAYLHFGMVSPFRIAREAAALRGAGPEKYLDELLIWRELAYVFCFYRRNHSDLSAMPKWAMETLRTHELDPRPVLLDWESLARAQTGDPLWDAAQLSLLIQGELHNNVRMTWGKAFLQWTPNAAEALRMMIDLNHRYALDGQDPASYGGLLWCLGQFDRPHQPEYPITGTVRTRPTTEHAARLDPSDYRAKTTRAWISPMPRIAVIGAGLSGLMCARTLNDHGFPVTIFDKSRRPGGRTATRRVEPDLAFDHGAQYFTIRHPQFARYVKAWQQQQTVAEWTGRVVKLASGRVSPTSACQRYVGTPSMTAIAHHLSRDLPIRYETQIRQLNRNAINWELVDDSGRCYGPFDNVVLTLPSSQTAALLPTHPWKEEISGKTMAPCWAVLLAFEQRLETAWDGAFVENSPLAWVARNSSKPGRPNGPDCWVLHASTDWSEIHLEESQEQVAMQLIEAFTEATGMPLPPLVYQAAHRWRYSIGQHERPDRSLYDPERGLVVCGDWLAGGRVEGAFLSSCSAAGHILRAVRMPNDP